MFGLLGQGGCRPLELAPEGLHRLRIAREMVAEVLAEMTPEMPVVTVEARQPPAGERVAAAYAGPSGRSSTC
ncbi:hypothetical protein GCM10010193_06910 [Kitasatospora atroaurantiaca]|uniref:hypothetical protein n=1 Tax=Kitasatospora atroaurantiaca TaxID=285545 RepID=UPI0011A51BD1|nr:hypothetical protein [Kitasatospora atroaurantiaca]